MWAGQRRGVSRRIEWSDLDDVCVNNNLEGKRQAAWESWLCPLVSFRVTQWFTDLLVGWEDGIGRVRPKGGWAVFVWTLEVRI